MFRKINVFYLTCVSQRVRNVDHVFVPEGKKSYATCVCQRV